MKIKISTSKEKYRILKNKKMGFDPSTVLAAVLGVKYGCGHRT